MNNQQIFDTVLTFLRAQGVPCTADNEDGHEGCVYRNSMGQKCAFGVLIPDELYTSEIEGSSVAGATAVPPEALLTHNAKILRSIIDRIGFEKRNYQLLIDLQRAHDSALSQGLIAWERAMKYVARNHYLEYKEVA